ncbi:hypothetical protein AAHC03_020710 [Spirometra sp. Aus1]
MFASHPQPAAEPKTDHFAGWLAESQLDLQYTLQGRQPDSSSLAIGGACDVLSLPQSFGSLFLGETFSCHINLHNESLIECRNVTLKVTIQNRSEFTQLATRGFSGGQLAALGSNSASLDPQKVTLKPQESLNAVVQHEMKDLGEHTLSCSVSYVISTPSGLRLPDQQVILPRQPSLSADQSAPKELETKHSFHKNFKFMVEKPLEVKTNIVEHEGSVTFIEAQIENLMPLPIFLEHISLEPGPQLRTTDLNKRDTCLDDNQNSPRTLHSKYACMRPHETWRFLYYTQPLLPGSGGRAFDAAGADGALALQQQQQPRSTNLGHLDITWRSSMGELGHLQTCPFTQNPPRVPELAAKVVGLPTEVEVEQPFQLLVRLTNRSARSLDLLLCRPTEHPNGGRPVSSFAAPDVFSTSAAPFIWTGVTHRRLAPLASGDSLLLPVDLLPVRPGLQELTGLHLKEVSTERAFNFYDLGHILVTPTTA